jgi:signal transduction histidine kinase
MRHSYYASNGHAASGPRVDSAMQGEAVRLTPTEIRIQREDATQHDSHDRNLAVELKGIVTAQMALSREVEVGRLVETLLMAAVELVGAERGLLFLARGRELEIEAETTTQGGGVRVVFSFPASATLPEFPQSVLRYVIRTEQSVVLDDASAENQFSDDDYLRGRRVRSILCLPLNAQRDLVGVLYLENNLAPQAFVPERLASLELLASQAAISLKAARLYVDLKQESNERRKAQQELERIRRMYGEVHLESGAELMGELTASLAHELNQPLGAILNNAYAVRRLLGVKKPDLVEISAAVEEIIGDNSRAVETIRNVRTLFQRGEAQMSSVDLKQVVLDAERILAGDAVLKKISFHLDLPASLPTVIGNRPQLIQALMNLVLNAFDAVCENGNGPREVEIRARARGTSGVHIAVRDSGNGIDPKVMPRLFDAFFTTKPEGMGMGLAIVRSIVENHRGRLWATRNPDRGATLEFELPGEANGEANAESKN